MALRSLLAMYVVGGSWWVKWKKKWKWDGDDEQEGDRWARKVGIGV